MLLSSVSHSSKLMRPKERVIGTSNLQLIYHMHKRRPELAVGV